MTVLSHLSGLASGLVITDTEKAGITTSITTLAARLDSYFQKDITSHILFGSYPRVTILPRKNDSNSDIDYMVVFSTANGQMKPQTYLTKLKNFAEAKYQASEITQSSPTIVLSLNHIKFELVPAIYNNGFQIPSPASSLVDWITTDPTGFSKTVTDKNTAEKSMIKPLIRLVKYWNASKGHLFTSYSLEQYIVSKYYSNCTSLKDYFYSFWDNFYCAPEIAQATKDKVATAKKYIQNAKDYEAVGNLTKAEEEIKKIVAAL